MQRGFRRACGDGGGGSDGGAFYLDGFLPHGVGLVLVHRLAVRLDGGGLQPFPAGGGEDRLPLGVGDTQGDGVGEVYLLVEAKGLVLVIHGDQDLGDGAAELGVHLPAQGGGDCAVHHRQQNRQQEGGQQGIQQGDAPLDGQGSHGAPRRVYPVPRMVWISLVGKARSILFRRYRMYTSTTLES